MLGFPHNNEKEKAQRHLFLLYLNYRETSVKVSCAV